VTASVLAEFVNHCSDDKELLAKVINCHLTSLTVTTIRIHALRGLSNIVSADKEELNKYSPTVLDALMSNIDDVNEGVALEAMTGLSRLFECIEHERVAPVLVNICNRIRPVLDKSIESLRAAAARLLGVLSRLGADSTTALAESLREQVHLTLPALVLHVNDEKVSVRVACKSALKRLVPLFRVDDFTKLFTQLDPEREIDYNEFLNLLSKHLVLSLA
jgi:HEAT repeat protein